MERERGKGEGIEEGGREIELFSSVSATDARHGPLQLHTQSVSPRSTLREERGKKEKGERGRKKRGRRRSRREERRKGKRGGKREEEDEEKKEEKEKEREREERAEKRSASYPTRNSLPKDCCMQCLFFQNQHAAAMAVVHLPRCRLRPTGSRCWCGRSCWRCGKSPFSRPARIGIEFHVERGGQHFGSQFLGILARLLFGLTKAVVPLR